MNLDKILKKLDLLQNDENFLVMLETAIYLNKLDALVQKMLPSYCGKNQTFNKKLYRFGFDVIENYMEEVNPFYEKLYDYYIKKMDFESLDDIDSECDIIYDFYTVHNDTNKMFEELKQFYIECSEIPEGYVKLTLPDGTKEILIAEEKLNTLLEPFDRIDHSKEKI